MAAWEMMKPQIEAGHADDAWIHLAWAILQEREACAKIADALANDVAGRYAEENAMAREIAELIRKQD